MGNLRRLSDHDDRAPERAIPLTGAADWLFARGHAADLILAVLFVELAWLVWARGWPPFAASARLLPGALMIVALRGALTGAEHVWIALTLACSFPIHLADLVLSPAGVLGRRR